MKNPVDLVVAKLHVAANNLIARGIRRRFSHRDHADLGAVLGSIAFGVVLIVALLIAAAIVFPSVQPGNIISTLGIGSVAIGFAFKDILQNLLAGNLILINRPFRRGDQIKVKEYAGMVEHIESRSTSIKTYDGRRVIIPNSDIYTSAVTVSTAFPTRRDSIDIGIGYDDDPARAATLFTEVAAAIEGVEADPPPETLVWNLDASTVTLRLRWWVKSPQAELVHTRSRVPLAVHAAAAERGVDLPFPTTTVLFHHQTDAADGDRTRQREGWPAGRDPPAPGRAAADRP